VDEVVIATIFRRDETIALVGIEEFDGSGDHEMFSFRENKKPSRKCTAGAGSARKEEEPILTSRFPSQATISNAHVGVI
jgi:hypothetical protein